MIDIKELNIGNYLRVAQEGLCIKKGTIVKINGIDAESKFIEKGLVGAISCHPLDEDQLDGGIWLAYLEPIEITPEILEKNGWRLGKYSSATLEIENKIVVLEFYESGTQLRIFNRAVDEGLQILDVRISGVHQLQNALTLCGINKEIEL